MKQVFLLLSLCVTLNAHAFTALAPTDSDFSEEIKDLEKILDKAEKHATDAGLDILVKSRSMISNGDLVLGSCWDYINDTLPEDRKNHIGWIASTIDSEACEISVFVCMTPETVEVIVLGRDFRPVQSAS